MTTMLKGGAVRVTVIGKAVRYDLFPVPGLRWAMENYIENRVHPGSFLEAVASNDLRGAVHCADDINKLRIAPVVEWFHRNAPSDCWGSAEAVDTWLNREAA